MPLSREESIETSPPRRRPRILLVDDIPTNLDILVCMLKADYDLRVANSGAKAIAICESSEPIDLILLDVLMPGMNGFEVCRVLRSQEKTKEIPVVFLAASSEVYDMLHGFEAGGSDYLTKPFRHEELRARVRTQLTLHEQRLEIQKKNQELKQMIRIICHDVANHFTVLEMGFELIKDAEGTSSAKYRPMMRAAVKNGLQLTEMVREMRRSEEKGLNLQNVSLHDAIQESLLLLEAKFTAKNVRPLVQIPNVVVIAEPCALINSVFNNVLTNAVKFSHPNSPIEISASCHDDFVCIRFQDHGVGMNASVLQHLFDIGRSHTQTGTAGERGTGFGMPVMRRFVEQFGGKVEVLSRCQESDPENHGTEFKIWLRLAPHPPIPSPSPNSP